MRNSQQFLNKVRDNPHLLSDIEDDSSPIANQKLNKTEQKNYRSGELVALYFKHLGLIKGPPYGKARNFYEPKDFSQNGNALNFIDNTVSLGDEQTIMFDELDIARKIAERNKKIRDQDGSFVGRIKQTWDTNGKEADLSIIGEETFDASLMVAENERVASGTDNVFGQV